MTKKDVVTPATISELPDGPADDNGLTTRQQLILDVIKKAILTNGYPPSMREIGQAAGLASPASVKYQIEALVDKGFIRKDASKGRAFEITDPNDADSIKPEKTVNVPLVGRIAAGGPITAEQHIEEVFPLPESLVGQGELFLLKVVGDSMIDGEATVKTFSKKDGHYWLLPANDNYAPIPADNAEILGKVTAVLRSVR